MRTQLKLLSAIIALAICPTHAKAQSEYLIKLDNSTGNFQTIKRLDSVKWITLGTAAYNTRRHVYTFTGRDSMAAAPNKLISTTSANGSIINKPLFNHQYAPIELEYNISNDTLYGMRWDNATSSEYFLKIDPATGVYTDLTVINNIQGLPADAAELDPVHGIYYVFGTGMTVRYIYTIDIAGRKVTKNQLQLPNNTDGLDGMQYDLALDKLFCIYLEGSTQTCYISTVDSTGKVTKIAPIAGMKYTQQAGYCYDQQNHYYILRGTDTANKSRLYTIDVKNGNVVYNPLYPQPAPGDNLIYPMYDTGTNAIYALYWGSTVHPIDTVEHPDYIPVLEQQQQHCLNIPNAFTPNGDGHNDVFRVRAACNTIQRYSLTIFNRYGQRLYKTTDIYSGWDGTWRGTPREQDVYIYLIEYTTPEGREQLSGNVTLIR